MIAHVLRHWTACVAPGLECPTDPKGIVIEPCPRCQAPCGLHYGRRGRKFFVMHPPSTHCRLSCVTWRALKKEDALAFFREDSRAPGEPEAPAEAEASPFNE